MTVKRQILTKEWQLKRQILTCLRPN